jgi:hypothetical protein
MKNKYYFFISIFLILKLTENTTKIPEWREFDNYASNKNLQYTPKSKFQQQKNSIFFQSIAGLSAIPALVTKENVKNILKTTKACSSQKI